MKEDTLVSKIINPLDDTRWDPFVSAHPYGAVYQHSMWFNVITQTYPHLKPMCFILEGQGGAIRAAIACCLVRSRLTGTRIVSLPFSPFSDVLATDPRDAQTLLTAAIRESLALRCDYLELRTFRNAAPASNEALVRQCTQKTHVLDISGGFEEAKSRFHKDCITRSVRKALKSGVEVEECLTETGLHEYYFIHTMTRKRLGYPIQPYSLFENMWKLLKRGDNLRLLLARYAGKAIAGVVLFKFKETVSFEHGASLKEHLGERPNHLLLWNGIQLACAEGYRSFDLGKTTQDNKGLLDFKRRWGAQEFDVPYFYFPKVRGLMSLQHDSPKRGLISFVESRMPMVLAKAVGKIVYKHIG